MLELDLPAISRDATRIKERDVDISYELPKKKRNTSLVQSLSSLNVSGQANRVQAAGYASATPSILHGPARPALRYRTWRRLATSTNKVQDF
jgi:hypothetical protein